MIKVPESSAVIFEDRGLFIIEIKDRELQKLLLSIADVTHEDNMFVLPWTDDSLRLLKNSGVETLGLTKMLWQYDFPKIEGMYQPMAHQLITAAFMTLYPRAYVLNDPRTGKTGATLLAVDYMQKHGTISGGCLIITTLSTLYSVWEVAIRNTLPTAMVEIVHGNEREAALERPADFYITNYESCRIAPDAFKRAITQGRIGMCAIDELTHVGNYTSKRSRAMNSFLNGDVHLDHVVGLTGSPGEDPEKVFGMCYMINRGGLPCRSLYSWKDLITQRWGAADWQRSPRPEAPAIIHKAMQPAIRFEKKDIMDLPPVVTQLRKCGMSAEQKRMYKELKAEMQTLTDSGVEVTAVNGAGLYHKVMQVAQGIAKVGDVEKAIDHKERTQVLLEAIAETNYKVVVFCCYTSVLDMVAADIAAAGYTVKTVDGRTSATERAAIFTAFQGTPNPHILVVHPTTTAFGVELAAADTLIYYGPIAVGNFILSQSLERVSSTKQQSDKISVINIASCVEEVEHFKQAEQGLALGRIIANLFAEIKDIVVDN
jgi:hypothetical protein